MMLHFDRPTVYNATPESLILLKSRTNVFMTDQFKWLARTLATLSSIQQLIRVTSEKYCHLSIDTVGTVLQLYNSSQNSLT